jgi:hypothetical protein
MKVIFLQEQHAEIRYACAGNLQSWATHISTSSQTLTMSGEYAVAPGQRTEIPSRAAALKPMLWIRIRKDRIQCRQGGFSRIPR